MLQQGSEKTDSLKRSIQSRRLRQPAKEKVASKISVKANSTDQVSPRIAKRKRGRPPKSQQLLQNQNANQNAMPELEAYMRLDCSVSHVSPDSGIQSVAGSPSHQSCSPASNPPAYSPAPVTSSKAPSPLPPSLVPYSSSANSILKINAKNIDPRKKHSGSSSVSNAKYQSLNSPQSLISDVSSFEEFFYSFQPNFFKSQFRLSKSKQTIQSFTFICIVLSKCSQ